MTARHAPALALLALLPALSRAAPPAADAPGARDSTLFTRPSGFLLSSATHATELPLDRVEFRVASGERVGKVAVEGRTFRYRYSLDPAAGGTASALATIRSYQAAAREAGGEVLLDLPGETTLRLRRADTEVWAHLQVSNPFAGYFLTVVERAAPEQAVAARAEALQAGPAASADQLQASLTASGHVEVPGLLFDTGRSALRAGAEVPLA
jgi:hypothetical protein